MKCEQCHMCCNHLMHPLMCNHSDFSWQCSSLLQSAGKGQRGNLVRCGQCHMCRNPLMKKPCLHPIVPRGLDGSDEGTSAPKYAQSCKSFVLCLRLTTFQAETSMQYLTMIVHAWQYCSCALVARLSTGLLHMLCCDTILLCVW